MKLFVMLSFALAFAPSASFAQSAVAPGAPTITGDRPSLTPQQQAAMQQLRTQFQQTRLQTRARLLAALTPAHRTAVANVVGQLALAENPNPRAAAQALDAMLAPAEKESIINIAAAERANTQALMQQQRTVMAASMTAEQQAKMAAREARRQSFMASHPHPTHVPDAGAIVLRTLSTYGGGGGPWMHGGRS